MKGGGGCGEGKLGGKGGGVGRWGGGNLPKLIILYFFCRTDQKGVPYSTDSCCCFHHNWNRNIDCIDGDRL